MNQPEATLFVVATPIGNLEDLSFRAARILGQVDALACEDTRRTRILLKRYNIAPPETILAYHEHNEERASERVLALLKEGRSVALCSDAGYPGISDPGYRIIAGAIELGFRVEVIPGAGAVETALLLSGLPTSKYTFKGFPPRKPGARRKFLEAERDLPHTLVIFESPYRVEKLLREAYELLGDRKAAVCLELTKRFERVHRGFLTEILEDIGNMKIKGEATIVIAGNDPKFIRPG